MIQWIYSPMGCEFANPRQTPHLRCSFKYNVICRMEGEEFGDIPPIVVYVASRQGGRQECSGVNVGK